MASVLQLIRRLETRPEIPEVPGYKLRHYGGLADVDVWINLRQKAFAGQKLGVREWSREDFSAEFLSKFWWQPEMMWFAEAYDSLLLPPHDVGTVTLGWRGPDANSTKPVIHWLAVLPRYRRHGIARMLVRNLEAAVWDAGLREIGLETHVAWAEAVEFYSAMGYEPA